MGAVLAANLPQFAVAVVLVNSAEYGGTGDDNASITLTLHTFTKAR